MNCSESTVDTEHRDKTEGAEGKDTTDDEDASIFSPMDMLKQIKTEVQDLGSSMNMLTRKLEETRAAAETLQVQQDNANTQTMRPTLDQVTLDRIDKLQTVMGQIVQHLTNTEVAPERTDG